MWTAKLFALFDCCHSGTMLDLRYECRVSNNYASNASNASNAKVPAFYFKQNLCDSISQANVIALGGCMDSQVSADTYLGHTNQGALTWAFFEIIGKSVNVSYKSLLIGVCSLLRKRKYQQVPQLSSGHFVDLKSYFRL